MSGEEDQKELSDLAERHEPRMEAQFIRAASSLKSQVNLDRLTLALADGDREKAYRAVMSDTRLKEAMDPIRKSIRDDLIPKGGRLGARILRRK
jgi:hypothetical protein